MVKRTELKAYHAQRNWKALIALNLKADDEVVNVHVTNGNMDIFIASNKGYGLWYHESEVKVVGQRAAGVKAIQLKDGEYVVNGEVFDDLSEPSLVLITQRGACKRMRLKEFTKTSRAKRGVVMLRELKSKPHYVKGFYLMFENDYLEFRTENGEAHSINPLELTTSDRYSNGSFIVDSDSNGEVVEVWRKSQYKKPFDESKE